MSWLRRHGAVLLGFVLLTVLLTYPISTQVDRAVSELVGDPLLNSWIWAWEVRSLESAGKISFFDANIFYPHSNTLAYSELLLPQLVLAAPVILWSGNPILAHNLVLLASFVATAFGAYLLAFHCTGSRSASLVAGLILAYCPFMFYHLARVQILFAAGIPLTFLFLHRWLQKGQTRDLVLMAVVYAVQVLGNAYYAVYLTFFAGIYLLVEFCHRRLWGRPKAWKQLLLASVIAASLIAPVYSRYLPLRREMAFSRAPGPAVPVTTYLAPVDSNRLYGESLKSLGRTEAHLFPGFVAIGLAVLAIGARLTWPTTSTSTRPWHGFQLVEGLILLLVFLLFAIDQGLRIDTQLGPVNISLNSMDNPIGALILLLALRALMLACWPDRCRRLLPSMERPALPILLLAGFWLSLGTGPFHVLHRWLPGFDNLRAVPRIHVMFMLAVALLAAEALLIVRRGLHGNWRRVVTWCIPLLILAEYFSAPVPVAAAPKKEEFPAVHHWLLEQDPKTTFVAYPLRRREEELRVFYSTLHWRRSLNGYSGHFPPLYDEIMSLGQRYPTPAAVADFRALGVDLLLVDLKFFAVSRRPKLLNRLRRTEGLSKLEVLDGIAVYRIDPQRLAPTHQADADLVALPVSPDQLKITASFDPARAGHLIDGDRNTVWEAPMAADEFLEIELDRELPIRGLELDLGGHARAYPRGYRIEISQDGLQWKQVGADPDFRPPIVDFVKPSEMVLRFEVPVSESRWVRIVQTGRSRELVWRVAELRILAAAS